MPMTGRRFIYYIWTRQGNGKTNRHKRRLEDSEDLFDRRSKNRRSGRKHGKPMDKGGKDIELWADSNPLERNANGRTRSGLYRLFIPAYESLEGFFDEYGRPVIEDPSSVVSGIDGDDIYLGAKTYLKNERAGLKDDPPELNEVTRQFPFTTDEAFRDSIDGSVFNIGKIYQQIEYNDDLFPNPVVQGNFMWENGERDTNVIFSPDVNGRFFVSWMPPEESRNVKSTEKGKSAPFPDLGVGGVDSYDLDETVDGRGSKGAMHLYNKFNMNGASNMFVYTPLARHG